MWFIVKSLVGLWWVELLRDFDFFYLVFDGVVVVVDDEYSEDVGEDDDIDSDKYLMFVFIIIVFRGFRGFVRWNNVVFDGDVVLSEFFVVEGVVD